MKFSSRTKIHLLYWCITRPIDFFLYTYPYYNPEGEGNVLFWSMSLFDRVLVISTFYLYYSIIIPKYLFEKPRYGKFLLILFGLMIVRAVFSFCIWNSYVMIYGGFDFIACLIKDSNGLFNGGTFIPVLAITVKYIEAWTDSELLKQKLKKLNVESKINFLKTQINPHFLFNTLNNIYSLSLKGSALTDQAIGKLKTTFKYLTKIEKENKVMVRTEFEYLRSYIDLNKLRLVDPRKVHVDLSYMDGEMKLFPMIIIPFLENAFKHANLTDEKGFISIDIQGEEKQVSVLIENSVTEKQVQKDAHSGIGLENVKSRLKLLFENDTYNLSITNSSRKFITKLTFPYADA